VRAEAPAGLRWYSHSCRLPVAGVALLVVTVIVLGDGAWWKVLLVPVAALAFYAADRFPPSVQCHNHEFDGRDLTVACDVADISLCANRVCCDESVERREGADDEG
jgi:hypothetical protein